MSDGTRLDGLDAKRHAEDSEMSSEAWGVSRPAPATAAAKPAAKTKGTAKLSPSAAQSAHRGIVWIHLSAIAVWLFVAALLGVLAAAGKAVPAMVIVAGLAAAAGHTLFLVTHWLLASLAHKRAAPLNAAPPQKL